MSTIPLKQQLITRLTSDATLIALLGDGANSVLPQAGLHPGQDTATPFIVVRMGAETPTSSITARQFVTFWVYDNPLQGYWAIDRIITQLRVLLEGYEGLTFDGRSWGRSEYDGASEESTDDAWNKVFKTARFSIPRL